MALTRNMYAAWLVFGLTVVLSIVLLLVVFGVFDDIQEPGEIPYGQQVPPRIADNNEKTAPRLVTHA